MAFMAFDGCTPAPSTEIALSPEITQILQAAGITLSFMTRAEAERILAEQAAEEIDVILDAEAIRLRDL